MDDLTPAQLEAKIAQVEKDIEIVRSTDRKGAEHLSEYMSYLKDELKMLKEKRGTK